MADIRSGVSSKGSTTGATTIVTAPVDTQPTGSAIIVGLWWSTAGNFTSLVDSKGNSYTQVGTELVFGSGRARCYYKENAVGGSAHTHTLTMDSTTSGTILSSEVIDGKLVGILEQSDFRNDNSSPATLAAGLTTAQARVLLASFLAGDSASNPATLAESGLGGSVIQVSELDGSTVWGCGIATVQKTSTGTFNPSWTQSGAADFGVWLLVFQELSGGPPVGEIDWDAQYDWKPQRWDFPLGVDLLFDDYLPSVAFVYDISAELNASLDAVTASSAGTLSISATSTPTLANVTSSATGTSAIASALAGTVGPATLSSTGTLSLSALLTGTLGSVTLSSTGTNAIASALAGQLDSVTLSSTGALSITASLSKTLDAVTVSSVGALLITSSLTKTLEPVTLSATATLEDPPEEEDIFGELNATLDNVTLNAFGQRGRTLRAGGSILRRAKAQAEVSVTLEDVKLVARGHLHSNVKVSVTLGEMRVVAASRAHWDHEDEEIMLMSSAAAATFLNSVYNRARPTERAQNEAQNS